MKIKLFFLFGITLPVVASAEDNHSLYYEYTIQSGFSTDDVFDSTAVTVLDGRRIDSYSSRNRTRTAKQDWLRNLSQRDWDRGTTELQQYGRWLNNQIHTVIKDFGHSISGVHVLQWRFGCETDATFNVLSFIYVFGYDGEDLISYDWTSKQWKISVKQAQNTAEKFNKEHGHDIVYVRCVEWMKIYLNYSKAEIRQMNVYVFSKRAVSDPDKVTLTCLVTGFYPKDVMMSVRKNHTSLPEEIITSSGVRPNDDDTYQLRKSVDVLENEKADYDCYVTHSSLKEPVNTKWDEKFNEYSEEKVSSFTSVGVFGIINTLAVTSVIVFIFFLFKRRIYSGRWIK